MMSRSLSLSPLQAKKQQQKIEMVLDGKKITYEKVDIAASEDAKKRMREIAENPKALAPQLCNGDTYCGVSYIAWWSEGGDCGEGIVE